MYKAIIKRVYYPEQTQGAFILFNGVDKIAEFKTLELGDKDNQRNISCIPEGTYQVKIYESNARGWVYHVKDVPNRDAILIHSGNYVQGPKIDSEGCILPGLYFMDINNDTHIDIAHSKRALKMLLDLKIKEFELTILS